MDLRIRFWSVWGLGTLAGSRLTVDVYSGPRIALGFAIAFGLGITAAVLSLLKYGRLGLRVGAQLSFLVLRG